MSGIYSAAELQTYSLEKLHALYRVVQQELLESAPGSQERINALANLENITYAINIARVYHHRPKPGPGL